LKIKLKSRNEMNAACKRGVAFRLLGARWHTTLV
jgi:hypothetical protein